MSEYTKGLVATVGMGAFTVREVLSNGSLFFTMLGAALALGAGVWTYKTAKAKARMAEIELQMKELEYARALDKGDEA